MIEKVGPIKTSLLGPKKHTKIYDVNFSETLKIIKMALSSILCDYNKELKLKAKEKGQNQSLNLS